MEGVPVKHRLSRQYWSLAQSVDVTHLFTHFLSKGLHSWPPEHVSTHDAFPGWVDLVETTAARIR